MLSPTVETICGLTGRLPEAVGFGSHRTGLSITLTQKVTVTMAALPCASKRVHVILVEEPLLEYHAEEAVTTMSIYIEVCRVTLTLATAKLTVSL